MSTTGWTIETDSGSLGTGAQFYAVHVGAVTVWEGQSATRRDEVLACVDGWDAEDVATFRAEGVSLDDLLDIAAEAASERRVEARLERGGFLDGETADATSELLERHLRAAWMVEELRAHR